MCKTRVVETLLVLMLLVGVGNGVGWVEEWDGYANALEMTLANTGGVWDGTVHIYNWHGDDADGVSSAINTGSADQQNAWRSSDAGVKEFGSRIRIAPDGYGDGGPMVAIANTKSVGAEAGTNFIWFFALSTSDGSSSHMGLHASKWNGSWTENRVDVGSFNGTAFPLTLGVWYDMKVVEISDGVWEGSYKLVTDSVWTVFGQVNEQAGFASNYCGVGVRDFSRNGMVYVKGAVPTATGPSPDDGVLVVNLNTTLGWMAGSLVGDVNGHDVYFGLSESAVTNASVGNPMDVYQGRIDTASFDPGGLEGKKTYFWRVDEVNEDDPNLWAGEVWEFTTAYVIATFAIDGNDITATSGDLTYPGVSEPRDTINEDGLSGDLHDNNYENMWLGDKGSSSASYNGGTVSGENWIAYVFDQVYDLEKMWVWNYNNLYDPIDTGHGLKNVTIQYSATGGGNTADWTTLGGGTVQINKAPDPASAAYAHNTEIDFGGGKAKYVVITPDYGVGNGWWGPLEWYLGLSEVRFHYYAYLTDAIGPVPGDGSVGVSGNTSLSWTAGELATSHDVFLGTSFDDVANAGLLAGDVTGNGPVDEFDVLAVTNWWMTDGGGSDPCADLNRDGIVNFGDYSIVANDYGKSVEVFKGNVSETSYTPPDGLGYNATYYWRIDERYGDSFETGEVWSFSTHIAPVVEVVTPTASASKYYGLPEVVVDGTGLTGDLHSAWWPDNWADGGDLSGHTNINPGTVSGAVWIRFDFDVIYKLGDLWVWNFNDNWSPGYWQRGMRNVTIEYSLTGGTDSSDWSTLGDFEFANTQPCAPDMAHTEEIAFGGAEAKSVIITANDVNSNWGDPDGVHGLAEVRFYGYSPYASGPVPTEGAEGILPGQALSWNAGVQPGGGDVYVEAPGHDVYIGTDQAEVAGATRGSHANVTLSQAQAATSYTPVLNSDMTYYWRVDEVNDSGLPEFVGDVWSFSSIPSPAWNVVPADVGVTARILYWEPGFYAADVNGHDVYLGTSFNDVDTAGTTSAEYVGRISKNYYDIAAYDSFTGLTLGDTYYWRIDEVNDSVGAPVKGTVQSFTHARRVIFNTDGYGVLDEAGVFGEGGNPREKLDEWISYIFDPLEGTRVDTVSWCDGSGGNTALYGSEVLEPWGYRNGQSQNPPVDGTEPTVMAWIAEGNDPAKVVVEEGHKRGFEVWYSFRINDIHDAFIPEEFPTFKQDNPGWMIGDQPYGYPTALRFDVEEVRDIKFDTIVEMFTKYDMDGVEIDWMRSPTCFIPGTEPDNNDILTTFMARVRTRLNEVAIERGRPCLVATRVDETVETCSLDGFDINSWVENDSIDILILGSGAIDIDVEDFKAMAVAAGTDLKVYPCLYGYPSGYAMTAELAHAMATTYYHQGSDGIYTFNWCLHCASWEFVQDMIDIHYDIGDPADLVGKDKLYPADRQGLTGVPIREYPHNWWNLALPASLSAPETVEVPLRVGEDIDGVYTPTLIQLRVGFDGDLDGGDTFVIQLNGNPLAQVRGSGEITMTPLASQVLVGENTVSIQITGGVATADAVELHVNY